MRSTTLFLLLLCSIIFPLNSSGFQLSGRRKVQIQGIDKINIYCPQWSLNSRYLSFETIDEDNQRIYIFDVQKWTSPVEILKPPVSEKITSRLGGARGRPRGGPILKEKTANLGLIWVCDISESEMLFLSHDAIDKNIYYKKSLESPAQPMLLRTSEFQTLFSGLSYLDLDYSSKTLIFNAGKNKMIKVFRWQGALVENQNNLQRVSQPVEIKISEANVLPFEPRFNPAGAGLLAFTGGMDNNLDIYVYSSDSKKSSRLTDWPSIENFPRWSPDGRKILFLSENGHPEQKALYIMDRNGGNKNKICDWINDDQAEFVPIWHPDGKSIFYIEVDDAGGMPIRCYDLNSGKSSTLITNCIAHTSLAVSPDGKKIAFCAKSEETGKNLTWRSLYISELIH